MPATVALAATLALAAAAQAAAGPLVLIGGGADDIALMREAIALAPRPAVAVMTLASHDPAWSGTAYLDFLAGHGHAARHVPVPDARSAGTPATVGALTGAGLLFFSGGDQSRLVRRLQGTAALRAIAGAWRGGAVLAGTSAGAMPWGSHYIAGGTSPDALERPAEAPIKPGLGLVPGLLVDSHFSSRGRLGRLLVAMAAHQGDVGLGLDEGTAAIVAGGLVRVAGSGSVTVLDPHDLRVAMRRPFASGPFIMHRLPAGEAVRFPRARPRVPRFEPKTPLADKLAARAGIARSAGPPGVVFATDVWSPGAVGRLLATALAASRSVGVGLPPLATASVAGDRVTVRGGSALILDTRGATRLEFGATPLERGEHARDVVVSVVAPGVPYDLQSQQPELER